MKLDYFIVLLCCSIFLQVGCSSFANKEVNYKKKMNSYIISISDAGLPYRTPKIINREKKSIYSLLNSLSLSDRDNSEIPELSFDSLINVLQSEEDWRAYNAAFILGRISFNNDSLNHELLTHLKNIISTEIRSDVKIECAMSLVLKGKKDKGKKVLLNMVNEEGYLENQYKASFYLAQMGDLTGVEKFYKTLNSEIPHYRLMAMRHYIVFEPFNGFIINDTKVDVNKTLLKFLKDSDEMIRSEVPFYLEELGIKDLVKILETIVENDTSTLVKDAARMVIEKVLKDQNNDGQRAKSSKN